MKRFLKFIALAALVASTFAQAQQVPLNTAIRNGNIILTVTHSDKSNQGSQGNYLVTVLDTWLNTIDAFKVAVTYTVNGQTLTATQLFLPFYTQLADGQGVLVPYQQGIGVFQLNEPAVITSVVVSVEMATEGAAFGGAQ